MEICSSSFTNKKLSYNTLSITSTDSFDWSPFGKERREELKMIENSMFYYQLKTNDYINAWKEICAQINTQCNALGILYKERITLYLREIELHDIQPSNFSKRGTAPGGIGTSMHHSFFCPNNSIITTHKK